MKRNLLCHVANADEGVKLDFSDFEDDQDQDSDNIDVDKFVEEALAQCSLQEGDEWCEDDKYPSATSRVK